MRENALRQTLKKLATGLAALALGSTAAIAQSYPTKPITLVVPFAAGGPTDTVARIVASHMEKTLGQQIVVENVAGAGGTTGITRASQAAADGYTIMMGHMGTHAAAVPLYPNLKYNPAKDFTNIGLAAGTPVIIVAKKDIPAKDLKELVAHLRANAATVNQGHAGLGSVSHSSCTLFNSVVGIKPAQISYRGTGPALQDMIAGRMDYMCDQIVNLTPQIKAGEIKAYAIGSPERSPALPDVPTAKEAGMPEVGVSAWNALFGPKNLPADVASKLVGALDKALDDEATRKRLLDLGSVIPDKEGRKPAALQKLVESEVARWTPILTGVAAQ
jgi:tripartite-type tricarboxylate transporter receptor subunit TctC